MRKLIVRFIAFLLIVGGLTTSFLIVNPREKVKADTPSLYYFDIDTSHENYMSIILYVLDVANLQNDSCTARVEGYMFNPPYSYSFGNNYSITIQFSRYSQLDVNDYDAYIYNFTYPSNSSYKPLDIYVNTSSLTLDNNTTISYNLLLPYYPTFKEFYDDGYEHGHDVGYRDGTNDRNAYWEEYIEETYESTTGSGYQRIFEAGRTKGYRQGQESIDTTDWLQSVATDVGSILNIKLMPFITIGGLIFIPLMFIILGAILWIWRKK